MEEDFLNWWNAEGYERTTKLYCLVVGRPDNQDSEVNEPLFKYIKSLAFLSWKAALTQVQSDLANGDSFVGG